MTDQTNSLAWPSRAVAGAVMGSRPSRHRTLVLSAAAASVALIGLIDAATGRDLSVAVFYLLPVAAATILVSTQAGYALAVASALAWVLADNVIYDERDLLISLWNGVLRALTISVVVFLLGALRSALVEAASSRQRTEEFLTTAAHQLRTPIAGVMASAEALASEVDPDRRERITDNLVTSTERVGRLLTGLLEFSRLGSATASVTLQKQCSVDVAAICRAALVSSGVRVPGVRFEFKRSGAFLLPVNRPALSEAIANLLDNAGRHARSRVWIDLRMDDRWGVIEVRDDGPGIPVGMEQRVFDRFVAIDGRGGSGLGLPIARNLIESQGGTLYNPDQCFRIKLPLSQRLSNRSEPAARLLAQGGHHDNADNSDQSDTQRVFDQ